MWFNCVIRTVSLTKDFVFNEKEFQKIIEHEEMVDEREKAQKEYAERYNKSVNKSDLT